MKRKIEANKYLMAEMRLPNNKQFVKYDHDVGYSWEIN